MSEADLVTKVAVLEDRLNRLQTDHAVMKSEIQTQLGSIRGEIEGVRKEMKLDLLGVNDKLSAISFQITSISVKLAGDDGTKKGVEKGVVSTTKVAWAVLVALASVLGFLASAVFKVPGLTH